MIINYTKVSVLMPVFNGERYLREAIESIINQTYTNFELIIVNDGSTDQSVSIIESYKDSRIKLFHNDRNYGLSYTRNKCIEYAKGEYLAKLDCDDMALPTRLEEQVNFLDAHPEFGLIGSWVQFIDASGNLSEIVEFNAAPPVIPYVLLLNNYFAQSALMIRRSSLPDQWYRDDFPPAEDYDLWVRIARIHKVWNLQKVLTYYRIHTTNISKTKADVMEKAEKKILQWQLAELGLEPSQSMIADYYKISKRRFKSSEKELFWLKTCIERLIRANKVKSVYQEPGFSEYYFSFVDKRISNYRNKHFTNGTNYTIKLLKPFYFSPLAHYKAYSLKCQIQLIWKCFSGHIR